jgi:hypothetical protein
MADSKEPILEQFVLCDAVVKDANGKLAYLGVFDSFFRPGYVPQFFVVIKWVNGLGEHEFYYKILDPDLKPIFATPKDKMLLENRVATAVFMNQFNNFPIRSSGVHWAELFLNGKSYISIPIPVYTESKKK